MPLKKPLPAQAADLPCAPSTLTLPNDPRYAGAAAQYTAAVAKMIGFEAAALRQIRTGVRRALKVLIRLSFEPGEQAALEVTSAPIPAGIRIALRDRGLPLAPAAENAGQAPERPLFDLKAHFDEVQIRNRGREGKEIVLIKHLPDPSLSAYAAACVRDASGAAAAPGPGRGKAPAPSAFTVRPLDPAEAPEVSRAIYRAYGYSYPHDYVYYPEKIAELNRRGEISSAVAVAADGEIAGHCSLKLWEENPQIAELTQGVVAPRFRAQGVFSALTGFLIAAARSRGLAAVFGEAVTVHPYSQRTGLQSGSRDCALFLAMVPDATVFKDLGGAQPERGSMLVQFQHLAPPRQAPVHAPAAHRDMIAAIYANLGTTPGLDAPAPRSGAGRAPETVTTVRLIRPLNAARIRIDRCGPGVVDDTRRQLKALCVQRWDVVHLILGLSDPATARFCSRFEELGFFFAGILPRGLPSGDALVLQYLNNVRVRYEGICTASTFAARLRDYVRTRDPNRV
jgi:serine/threonine-protein kinase RsbW